jgi:hypothetical protein
LILTNNCCKYLEIDASFALILYLAPFCFALIAKRSHEALFGMRSVEDMIVVVNPHQTLAKYILMPCMH